MTKQEFLKRMLEVQARGWIKEEDGQRWFDAEHAHADADRLLAKALEELGYYEGIEIFKKMEKWYA